MHSCIVLFTPGVDDLFDVQSELIAVSAEWKSIGIALGLNPNVLSGIQTDNNDHTTCLLSVVTEWLKRNYDVKKFGEPTWRWLVKTVSDPAGGKNKAHARKVAMRHRSGGMSSRHIAEYYCMQGTYFCIWMWTHENLYWKNVIPLAWLWCAHMQVFWLSI